MRMEVKVYMSHTDLARVQMAASRSAETLSGFMRRQALEAADRMMVPQVRSILDGQRELSIAEKMGVE